LTNLKAFLGFCVERDFIEKNPAQYIKPFPFKSKIRKPLDKKTVNIMLAALKGTKFYEFCLTGLLTGLRKAELINLQWADVDFNNGVITVRHRGDFSTKNRKERIVPMPKKLQDALRDIRNRADKPVFIHKNGQRFANNLYRDIERILKTVGIPKIEFHQLRHTYISNLTKAGISPGKIMQWSGHSDYNVTANVYTHLTEYDPDVERIV
ncbi:tyrosine-type recombinase/integrase, partial [Planctomycetota bacterium]